MPSSIELSEAWQLRDIPDDHLADFLRISRQEVRGRRAVLAKQLADPAWIAATLEALPAATLAVLHLVIGARGAIDEDRLANLARERFGLSERDWRAAASEAIQRLLAVPLASHSRGRLLAVVQPAAGLIAPLVAGLDLLELPAADFAAVEVPSRNPRMFLAACASARCTEIRLTALGRIHRGSIKRLARQVGLDEVSLVALLEVGLDVGVLRVEADVARPDPAALAEAAEGRYPRYPPLTALAAQLGDAPVDLGAAARLLQRSLRAEDADLARDALGWLPGFVTGTVNGATACLRRVPGGTAAGHVTPSFEVFLPPESRLIDVVHVGACCEWERLDRAFVARITKSSISSAAAAGASAGQILAQLAAASRHPLPQNVEAAIRDWAGSVVSATIARGHVIVVDPGAGARVAAALARLEARELAPGVFVVDEDERLREITLALGRAGIHHREVSPVCDAPERGAATATVPAPPPAPAPASGAGAARLRARVAAWRRGEPFEGIRDDFLDKQRAAQSPPATAPGRPVLAMIERWAAKHCPGLLRDLPRYGSLADLVDPLSISELETVLDASEDLDDLIRELAQLEVKRLRPGASQRLASPPRRAPWHRSPPALLWQREDLRERLRYAGQRGEALALELATSVRYVEVSRVIQRGTTWMVLGDDLMSGDAVALPLDAILAVAAVPEDFDVDSVAGDDDDDDGGSVAAKPWRPAPGQVPPAGHIRCPCGSGVRYRHCCRPAVTA